ncbi:MAG: hypothetical protein U1F51_08890 [Burkholderiales bacterium]
MTPNVPLAPAAVDLRISDLTGVFAEVEEKSIQVVGTQIEVRASVRHGNTDVLGGYTLSYALSSLPAGLYTLSYVARTRTLNGTYGASFTEGVWQFLVVEPGSDRVAVEYYNAARQHYFVTALPNEIASLDAGVFAGWARTGESIRVLATGSPSVGTLPVCRFYGRPEAGLDSHFYSASSDECSFIQSHWPAAWLLESDNVFGVAPIDTATGQCPVNLLAVYRVYNNRSDVNHRYTTSTAIQAQMVASGWIAEGVGEVPAVWCALPP